MFRRVKRDIGVAVHPGEPLLRVIRKIPEPPLHLLPLEERLHGRRSDLHSDCLRLLLRPVEELRDDLGAVLRRDDLGQLDHAGDAKLARPERLDHLGEPLDEVGRPRRKTQVPLQVLEDAGVAELHPEPLPVEVGQRLQEVGHGAAFAVKKIGETSGRFACLVHARMLSRDFRPSPDARNHRLARFHADPLRTSPETRGAQQRLPAASRGAFTARHVVES